MAATHHTWIWQKLRAARLADARRAPEPCWRCGLVIDYTLSGRHPYGPHLDHVAPIALHPELALDPGNTRWSHNRCNTLAGASLGGRIVHGTLAATTSVNLAGGTPSRDW